MAKGARSSTTKTNRSNLRTRVFGPADQARTERLSQKLAEVVAQPKPERPEKMDIDKEQSVKSRSQTKGKALAEDGMDIDDETASAKMNHKKSSRKTTHRIHKKKRRQKPHAQVVFPSVKRHKRLQNEAQKKGSKR
ncbi:MAG: hypothetical protein M1831_002891 [Alyxoria varia]|nr:MAG: hypothetical protein M1831_002891 [Alyxoria varia]